MHNRTHLAWNSRKIHKANARQQYIRAIYNTVVIIIFIIIILPMTYFILFIYSLLF